MIEVGEKFDIHHNDKSFMATVELCQPVEEYKGFLFLHHLYKNKPFVMCVSPELPEPIDCLSGEGGWAHYLDMWLAGVVTIYYGVEPDIDLATKALKTKIDKLWEKRS